VGISHDTQHTDAQWRQVHYLEQGESHPYAISRSLAESQEGVRAPFRFLFGAEILRIKLFWILEKPLVLHDHRAGQRKHSFITTML
jgi:hypothetical protein